MVRKSLFEEARIDRDLKKVKDHAPRICRGRAVLSRGSALHKSSEQDKLDHFRPSKKAREAQHSKWGRWGRERRLGHRTKRRHLGFVGRGENLYFMLKPLVEFWDGEWRGVFQNSLRLLWGETTGVGVREGEDGLTESLLCNSGGKRWWWFRLWGAVWVKSGQVYLPRLNRMSVYHSAGYSAQ